MRVSDYLCSDVANDSVSELGVRLHAYIICLLGEDSESSRVVEQLPTFLDRLVRDFDTRNWRLWEAAMILAGYEASELVSLTRV